MACCDGCTQYVMNQVIYHKILTVVDTCWYFGGLAMIFEDDDGFMMQKCFQVWSGLNVDFPLQFRSSYSED